MPIAARKRRLPKPSKSSAETRRILSKLYSQHPGADTELHYSNPYELLVATILSAQTTDERVNQVTPALFKRYPDARALAAYHREAGSTEVTVEPLPFIWPQGIFSLGHTALPVPSDDPVYGISPPEGSLFNLGAVALRGESGALVIPLGTFARLRSNPFFDVIREKVIETLPR